MSKKNINVEIVPRNNESVERLLKRFTRKIKKEGIIQEVRDRRYYEKPSQKRRRQASERKRAIERAKRKKEITRNAKKSAKDSTAYDFSTDFNKRGVRRKTKPSVHTKKFKRMYGSKKS